ADTDIERPTDPGYRDPLPFEIGGRLDVGGDIELVRPDRPGVRDDDDVTAARRCGERFGAANVRDLRLTREERRKPGRARDELQVDVEEVLVEDSRFFGDVRGEEIGEDVAVRDDDLRAARLRRRAARDGGLSRAARRQRPCSGTGREDHDGGKSYR